MGIRDEMNTNPDDYLAFGLSMASLHQQMDEYIVHREYNSDFGDLDPLILARLYYTNIIILDTSRTGIVTIHTVCLRDQTTSSIAVQMRGDHFKGVVSKHSVTSSAFSSVDSSLYSRR